MGAALVVLVMRAPTLAAAAALFFSVLCFAYTAFTSSPEKPQRPGGEP